MDTLTTSVIESLRQLVAKLKKEDSPEYKRVANGDIFINPPIPYARKRCIGNPDPSQFYKFKVCVWMPFVTFPYVAIFCPCGGEWKPYGFSDPIGRRILDFDHSYYLVAYQYKCEKCHEKKISSKEEFLAQCPILMRNSFPCILTHRLGADKKVL